MSIYGAFSTARSGLTAHSAALAVIGNNIANVSTIAFKGSRAEFADLLSAEQGGQLGKIGLGTRIAAVRTLFGQGTFDTTGRALDMAIEGEGFFVLGNQDGLVYTRAGNFQIQADGTVTNLLGYALQGTPLGTTTGTRGDIVLQTSLTADPQATTAVTLGGNVDGATAPAGTFTTQVQVFDGQGVAHEVQLTFTKTATANQWTVDATVDGSEVTGGTPGTPSTLGSTTITFNPADGKYASGSPLNLTVGSWTSGATGTPVAIDLTAFTQQAGDSGVTQLEQDGFGKGGVQSLTVDEKGILTAHFDNGQTRDLYQLAIASFANPEGLTPGGNQIFRESSASGPALIGTAQTAGNGSIIGGALENSNVELAQQFIDLISTQRAFQANAKVITTGDQILSDLLNIIR
jgi:flagellar hook protein FlgE